MPRMQEAGQEVALLDKSQSAAILKERLTIDDRIHCPPSGDRPKGLTQQWVPERIA